ncbi:MAG: hypothetical protein L0215_04595 [Gemmataceae bacterium]|nr:hypothetical protein [Gemmataceae bacterium]
MNEPLADLESDPRFPSGKWTGFFLDKRLAGKHQMELTLTFRSGGLAGDGRDRVGKFVIHGKYEVAAGKCWFHKRYIGLHDVFYQGFAENKGIWGTWELTPKEVYGDIRGGFYIWPEGLGDPTAPELSEEAEVPVEGELVEAGK